MPKQTFYNLPEAKREHILAVAVAEFAQKGYKGASISHMVAAAGIAKGSFYQYFADLDDLYGYIVCEKIGERKLQVFAEQKPQLETLSLTEFLRVAFKQQVIWFMKEPQLLKIGVDFLRLAGEPIFQKLMEQYEEMRSTYFLPYIQFEVEQGELDPAVNANLLNFMLISLGQYLLFRYSGDELAGINPDMIDEIVDDLEYILINGIYSGGRGHGHHS